MRKPSCFLRWRCSRRVCRESFDDDDFIEGGIGLAINGRKANNDDDDDDAFENNHHFENTNVADFEDDDDDEVMVLRLASSEAPVRVSPDIKNVDRSCGAKNAETGVERFTGRVSAWPRLKSRTIRG